jgi:1,4-alpha-glucan branching enzyme
MDSNGSDRPAGRGRRRPPIKRPSEATRRKPVKVVFTLPATIYAEDVALCGEFNDWRGDDIKLVRDRRGRWHTTVALEPGRAYRFRYLLDGQRWENAWNADRYVPNPYGEDDSVLVLE